MAIEKKYLDLFIKVLKDTTLSLADSRLRDRVIKDANAEFITMQQEREVILKKFCDKDEEGNPKVTTNERGETIYHFANEVIVELNTELATLGDETVTIESIDPENVAKVHSFVEETNYKPLVGESEDIDAILAKIV